MRAQNNILEAKTMKATITLTQAGLTPEQARSTAELLRDIYLEGLHTPLTAVNAVDCKRGAATAPKVKAVIKLHDRDMSKQRRQKRKWGVMLLINNRPVPIAFGSKEGTMIYICTLLKNKIGERMFRHEIFNNSKGKHSKLSKSKSQKWLKAVYDTLFCGSNDDFATWSKKIQASRGHALDQGKSQACRKIKEALKLHPEALPHCLVGTVTDGNRDSYYSIAIKGDDITVPETLEHLVDEFYEMVGIAPME